MLLCYYFVCFFFLWKNKKKGEKKNFQPGPNNYILERGHQEMLNIFAKDIDIRYHSLVTSITEVGEETGVVVEEEEGASARRSQQRRRRVRH